MKPIKKLVAITGKYTDKNGNEKNQYHTCGKLFQREDGSMCVKLDAVPTAFNGWMNCYDLEENRPANNANGMKQARQALDNSVPVPENFADDDIPF